MERRETEFKLLLTGPNDVEALRATLPLAQDTPEQVSRQRNHYFDTPDATLSEAGCGLRLRLEDDAWALTAKGPGDEEDDGLSNRAEEECAIDPELAARVLTGEACPLRALEAHAPSSRLLERMLAARADAELVQVGAFNNQRTRLGPLSIDLDGEPRALVFEFDRTTFPGGRIDTELEVEVPAPDVEAAGRALRALFERAGVAWCPATTKAARFAQSLGNDAPHVLLRCLRAHGDFAGAADRVEQTFGCQRASTGKQFRFRCIRCPSNPCGTPPTSRGIVARRSW